MPTDEVSRITPANLSGLRPEGVANGAVLASGNATLGDRFDRIFRRPPQAHAALRVAQGTGRAPGALRRLRDAGPVSHGHPGRARACAPRRGPLRCLAHGPGTADG